MSVIPMSRAQAAGALKIWTIGIAKVGAKDWSAMEAHSPALRFAATAKSARADEAIQKMVVGDGNKLFDALTDNGGGMEDALASQKAIVPLDTEDPELEKHPAGPKEGGAGRRHHPARTARSTPSPYISNADSMAYNDSKIGSAFIPTAGA